MQNTLSGVQFFHLCYSTYSASVLNDDDDDSEQLSLIIEDENV